jgi:hypothetical protein
MIPQLIIYIYQDKLCEDQDVQSYSSRMISPKREVFPLRNFVQAYAPRDMIRLCV